jgi:hypothetical protein
LLTIGLTKWILDKRPRDFFYLDETTPSERATFAIEYVQFLKVQQFKVAQAILELDENQLQQIRGLIKQGRYLANFLFVPFSERRNFADITWRGLSGKYRQVKSRDENRACTFIKDSLVDGLELVFEEAEFNQNPLVQQELELQHERNQRIVEEEIETNSW